MRLFSYIFLFLFMPAALRGARPVLSSVGSGRIGAVVLSKKEALVLHLVFCSRLCRSCVVDAPVRPGVGVPRCWSRGPGAGIVTDFQ